MMYDRWLRYSSFVALSRRAVKVCRVCPRATEYEANIFRSA